MKTIKFIYYIYNQKLKTTNYESSTQKKGT